MPSCGVIITVSSVVIQFLKSAQVIKNFTNTYEFVDKIKTSMTRSKIAIDKFDGLLLRTRTN